MMHRLLLAFWLLGGTAAAVPRPNVLFIAVDDLRPELRSFGVEYIHSPAIDALAASGRAFTRHYVQAPTCGASRYALLTGLYGTTPELRRNNALLHSVGDADAAPYSLPRQFREHGYRTVAVGKISHYPGGRGGNDWNDPVQVELPGAWDVNVMPTGPWLTPQRAMHGYAHGQARVPLQTPAHEHVAGDDLTYTDGWIIREALGQLETLAAGDVPFFLAVGILKPHLPFAAPQAYRDLYADVELPPIPHPSRPESLSTWHVSAEFFNQYAHGGRDPREDADYADELRRAYAACVSYADAQVAQLLAKLDELGLTENTIVVLWGDHGFHLGEHGVWGKHTLFEESLRAPLIIRTPGMTRPGVATAAIVETVDLYPTLCDLAGLETPAGLAGTSLRPQLADPTIAGDVALAFAPGAETVRTARHRLIRHSPIEGAVDYELYDHDSPEAETANLAATHPELVKELGRRLLP